MVIVFFLLVIGVPSRSEVIRFDPPSQFVDLDTEDSVFFFEVYIQSTGEWDYFNSIDVFLGSDYVKVSDFSLNPEFIERTGIFNKVLPVGWQGGYANTIFTGGFSPEVILRPYFIGTVMVDTYNMPSGVYKLQVDSHKDDNKSNVTVGNIVDGYHSEKLFGSATITVNNSAILPTCANNDDCDDNIDCTNDRCNISQCEYIYIDGCGEGSESNDAGYVIEVRNVITDSELITFASVARVEYEVENIQVTNQDLPSSIAQLPSLCGTIGMIPLMFMMLGLSGCKVRRRS